MRPVMIIDDEANYVSRSDKGTDILPPFNRYILHTYHNGKRDNINYGGDIDDVLDRLRFVMAQCPIGVFKAEIWDCLTYKLIFTAEDQIEGHSADTLQ
jgi:hypothetical protein